jgi:hypothetical protein
MYAAGYKRISIEFRYITDDACANDSFFQLIARPRALLLHSFDGCERPDGYETFATACSISATAWPDLSARCDFVFRFIQRRVLQSVNELAQPLVRTIRLSAEMHGRIVGYALAATVRITKRIAASSSRKNTRET